MKNNYARRLMEKNQKHLNIGMDCGRQLWADLVAIALNDPAVMGKGVLGKGRLLKVFGKVQELEDQFWDALGTGPEADYCRDQLDKRLKQIYGELDQPEDEEEFETEGGFDA